MRQWEKALIGPKATFRDALVSIDANGAGIALIVDEQRRLLGVLSDGDLRRALIRGAVLEEAAINGANRDPFCIDQHQDRSVTLAMIRAHGLRQLPVVDAARCVIGLTTISDFLNVPIRTNSVVIMAGGKGERLAELTRDTPKPMLTVGPRPILDTIVGTLAGQGFRNFWLAVNYKAEQIERHFGDGSTLGLNIQYLYEQKPLGTCGSLSLLPPQDEPLIVTNGDVLAKIDYGYALDAHIKAGSQATVMVRDYQMQVPFGVVRTQAGRILQIDEKPTQTFTISAGGYVLSAETLSRVPPNAYYDMPNLIGALITEGLTVRDHLAEGYWMDIGRLPDYAQANEDYGSKFEP